MRFIFILGFLSFSLMASGQLTRSINKTFPVDSLSSLTAEFDFDVAVEEWSGSRILVETNISLENASVPIIEALIEAGRYDIQSSKQGSALELSFNSLEKQVIVKKVYVIETISLRIFVPKGFPVEVRKPDPGPMADPYNEDQ